MSKKRYKFRPEFIRLVRITVLIGSMLLISTFCLVKIYRTLNTTFTLMSEVEEVKKQYAALQAENEYLINQKQKLNDEDYVSSWARGKYSLTKKGENVFQLPSNDED